MTIEIFRNRQKAEADRKDMLKRLEEWASDSGKWLSKIRRTTRVRAVKWTGEISPGHCGVRIINGGGEPVKGRIYYSHSLNSKRDMRMCGFDT